MHPRTNRPPADRRALWAPLALTAAFLALTALPRIHDNPRLLWSFVGAGGVLLVWLAALAWRLAQSGQSRRLSLEFRSQHYVQFAVQAGVFAYWGWHWPPVFDHLPHVVAQILFAYTFDILLAFSRREQHTIGFGPLPVVLGTNLFMWFKDDWFYFQFLMNAGGMAGKEFIRWTRDGRRVHVFNPSALSLSVFSMALIVTGTTELTWGEEVAQTLNYPAQIYAWIFLLGLVVQHLFGVTLMTLAAVVTVAVFSLGYFAATGVYYFFDSHIPIAVFLGMHLLFTDPSTSPRTALGRVIFGVLYGLWVIVLYRLLGAYAIPTFYDKLLGVPFLNMTVRRIDAWVGALAVERRWAEWAANRQALRLNPAYMALWIGIFIAMQSSGTVGDAHEGATVPFWQRACAEGKPEACRNLTTMLATYCRSGSGWACNELGIRLAEGAGVPSDPSAAVASFQRACTLGMSAACGNVAAVRPSAGVAPRRAPPAESDFYILLSGNKGRLPEIDQTALLERGCDQSWPSACFVLGARFMSGSGGTIDLARAATAFGKGCDLGDASSCSNAGLIYRRGEGVPRDDGRALAYLERACGLGLPVACRWLENERDAIARTAR